MTDDVVVDQVSHRYGSRYTLRGIDFAVPRGQVVALVGRNGAGKSTLLGLLQGFGTPTDGKVRVLGTDPARGNRSWRAQVGLVLQSSSLDPVVTVGEWLAVVRAAHPRPLPTDELLHLVDLVDCVRRRIGTLSGGQQRRVDLATALVGRPKVLFLDEPTTALDPEARRQVWSAVEALSRRGATIVLSTHQLDEADRLADRILVLGGGRMIADTTPARLRAAGGRGTVRLDAPAHLVSGALPRGFTAYRHGLRCVLVARTEDVRATVAELLRFAAPQRLDLSSLEVSPPSLEDAYLAVTGERLEAMSDA